MTMFERKKNKIPAVPHQFHLRRSLHVHQLVVEFLIRRVSAQIYHFLAVLLYLSPSTVLHTLNLEMLITEISYYSYVIKNKRENGNKQIRFCNTFIQNSIAFLLLLISFWFLGNISYFIPFWKFPFPLSVTIFGYRYWFVNVFNC